MSGLHDTLVRFSIVLSLFIVGSTSGCHCAGSRFVPRDDLEDLIDAEPIELAGAGRSGSVVWLGRVREMSRTTDEAVNVVCDYLRVEEVPLGALRELRGDQLLVVPSSRTRKTEQRFSVTLSPALARTTYWKYVRESGLALWYGRARCDDGEVTVATHRWFVPVKLDGASDWKPVSFAEWGADR